MGSGSSSRNYLWYKEKPSDLERNQCDGYEFMIINIICTDSLGSKDKVFNFVVENEHEGATRSSKNVGECSLEESGATFRFSDLAPTVQGTLVHDLALLATALHHHTPSHRVKWIGDYAGGRGHRLSNQPGDNYGGVLRVGEHSLSSVEAAEVGGPVNDDALDRHVETSVQTNHTVTSEDLGQAVSQASELSLLHALADVSRQPRSGEVQGIDEAERRGARSTT